MTQDLTLPLDVMVAAPVCGDLQGHSLKLYAVIFAHRSLKMFAVHIVQDAPISRVSWRHSVRPPPGIR